MDWADKLAAEIMLEQRRFGHHADYAGILAARLRLIRTEGEMIGIEEGAKIAHKAIDRVCGMGAAA